MILVKPSHEILTDTIEFCSMEQLRIIEQAGRVCYKSEDAITPDSHEKFIKGLLKRGHESVIEHSAITVKFICDRGVSHELVRHRLASFSQESTRYCDYAGGVAFIIPPWIKLPDVYVGKNILGFMPEKSTTFSDGTKCWFNGMFSAEQHYISLRNEYGWSPQQARSVLPNSLKTEIVVTANLREWRHILKLRAVGTTGKPHPQMSELMVPLLKEFKEKIPVIFDDLEVKDGK